MKEKLLTKVISTNFELLLQAALFSGEAAQKAFVDWKNAVDLEFLNDEISYYLLPKLYVNQQHNNLDSDKLFRKLKGIYRRTWLENQLRIPHLLGVLEVFKEHQIDFIVLSKTPLVLNLLKDKGIFLLDNFDLLIDSNQILEADKILQKKGWLTEQNPAIDENIFYRNEKSAQIVLRQSQSNSSMWKNAIEIDFCLTKIKVPKTEEQILALTDSTLATENAGLWAFYFYLILATNEVSINWNYLLIEGNNRQICHKLFTKLKYLKEIFGIAIPSEFFDELKRNAKKELAVSGKFQRALAAYRSLQKSYQNSLTEKDKSHHLGGFIIFLSRHWQTNSIAAIPWQIGKRFLRINRDFE